MQIFLIFVVIVLYLILGNLLIKRIMILFNENPSNSKIGVLFCTFAWPIVVCVLVLLAVIAAVSISFSIIKEKLFENNINH